MEGYDIFSTGLSSDSGRGIIIYTSASLMVNEISIPNSYRECVAIQVKLQNNDCVYLYAVYRSPNSDGDNNVELFELIQRVTESNVANVVILGDFNFPDINWETGTASNPASISQTFADTVRDSFLLEKVSKFTRQRGEDRPTLLDLVMVNEECLVGDIHHESPLGLSDHCMLNFDIIGTKEVRDNKIKKFFLNKANYDRIRRELNLDWQEVLGQVDQDINAMWGVFEETVRSAQNSFVPNKEVNPAKKKWRIPLDHKTVELVKKKHRAWQRYMETREREKLQEFRRIRNKVRKATRKGRRDFEMSIAKDVKENPKRFWSYVNSKTKSRSEIPDLKVIQNDKERVITSDQEKVNEFGRFFGEVLTVEADVPGENLVQHRVMTSMSEIQITREVVFKKLRNLKTDKSPGPDHIYPKILKEAAEELASPLCEIFNRSLLDGKVPDAWKSAQVCPIHKKGPKSICNNYRPVSLTSIACKMMESIIRDNIMEYMKTNKYFSDKQFGFLPGRSTVLQLLKMLDTWTEALDNGDVIEVLYLDIQKAFDTVPHRRLLLKLEALGIKDHILAWIKDFLNRRTQFVQIGTTKSAKFPVTSGVPQGSVLGPVLFVVYINDLPDHIKSHILMFADDTKLYQIHDGRSNNAIQDDIHELDIWTMKWQLKFHPEKCKQMIVSTRRRDQAVEERWMKQRKGEEVNIVGLKKVNEEKDLGITFDHELNFKEHISKIIIKASQVMGIIRRTFKSLDIEIFKPLYISLVRSRLEYGQSIWSPYKKGDIKRIEAVQRNATRQINGFRELSYNERLQRLKLPTLYFRRLRGDMIECYKIIRGIYDEDVSPEFQRVEGNRRGHEYKLFKRRTQSLDIRKYYFSNRVVDPWNSLPGDIVAAPSLNAFKNRLDKYWRNHPYRFDMPE
jgi:hypothetical protein